MEGNSGTQCYGIHWMVVGNMNDIDDGGMLGVGTECYALQGVHSMVGGNMDNGKGVHYLVRTGTEPKTGLDRIRPSVFGLVYHPRSDLVRSSVQFRSRPGGPDQWTEFS